MRHQLAVSTLLLAPLLLLACGEPPGDREVVPAKVRVATFNIFELGSEKLAERDSNGTIVNEQVRAAMETILSVRPDVLLLNEIDALPDDPSRAARELADALRAAGESAIDYPYVYSQFTNTGELSGFDLNRDGVVATAADRGSRTHGDDSWGYGTYPGQYGMAVLSRFPIDTAAVRTFRLFRWKDLPDAHIPTGWYSESILDQFRLSSKSHWDVPVLLPSDTLHLLASHPTPPGFDGDEDRNGRRNYDEVGFWVHYLDNAPVLRDDRGVSGGFGSSQPFVILGDLNAPPDQDDVGFAGGPAIAQLLGDPRIQDPPSITGRPTAFFQRGTRADYVLPSAALRVLDGAVVWPDSASDPAGAARAALASDHRLVWLDLALPLLEPQR